MTPLIEKYYDVEEIREIARSKGYDEVTLRVFVRLLDSTLADEEQDGPNEEEGATTVLAYVDKYMQVFEPIWKAGYSEAWSSAYAHEQFFEYSTEHAAGLAYEASYEVIPAQALADITLFAKQTGRDELFIKHFVQLVKEEGATPREPIEIQAESYSKIYREQIAAGKSEVFSHKYADLMACDGYTEVSCYAEALELENALKAGYSEEQARYIAFEMGEYIGNNFTRYEATLDDEYVEMQRVEVYGEVEKRLK